MDFSQRIGKTPMKTELQIESMDDPLRVALWNVVHTECIEPGVRRGVDSTYDEVNHGSDFFYFLRQVWADFLGQPLDRMGGKWNPIYEFIRKWYFKSEWFQAYELLQYVAKCDGPFDSQIFKAACNGAMQKNLSGYRFVADDILPITDKTEIQAIEAAVASAQRTTLTGVREHLKSAMGKLSDRQNPDYRNSIKEAISAVEALCQVILEKKGTLGDLLKQIPGLHPALKAGFGSLYGYTNDAGGIRHAMNATTDPVYLEDAKYMLVACSAFVSYLVAKASRSGRKLD